MFKLFKKDLTQMEKKDIELMSKNAERIEKICNELKNLFNDISQWEYYEEIEKDGHEQEEKILREDSEKAKKLLRELLKLLHNEEEEAKKALEDELEKKD